MLGLLLQAATTAPAGVDGAMQALATASVPGALLVVTFAALYRVHGQLNQVQEARVADAQKVMSAALEREEKWQAVLAELTTALEAERAERERQRRTP